MEAAKAASGGEVKAAAGGSRGGQDARWRSRIGTRMDEL